MAVQFEACYSPVGGARVKLKERIAYIILVCGISWLTTSSVLAQTRSGAVTIRYTTFSPFIALLAGILILIVPRLLNYIVAVYLILVGLIGIFGLESRRGALAWPQRHGHLAGPGRWPWIHRSLSSARLCMF
jgi:hypothetical protein